jgi:E3 ubiquitin-protein ligase BOI-like protein
MCIDRRGRSKALAEQRKKRIMLIDPAAVDRALKRLKEKDEEILHITAQNWALRERVIYFHRATQMWRDVALSKEATGNAPRGDLQRALDAHAVPGRGVEDVDDASSCCSGDNQYGVMKPQAAASGGRCKECGNGEAVELLLPCRHLCVCSPCAATARACPACGCAKTGSISVNFS